MPASANKLDNANKLDIAYVGNGHHKSSKGKPKLLKNLT